MLIRLVIAGAVACGLAACTNVNAPSGPPISGTTAGPGAPPLQQQTRDIGGGSANASAGTPAISGATTSGQPAVTYSGPGTAGIGGVPPVQQLRSRSN